MDIRLILRPKAFFRQRLWRSSPHCSDANRNASPWLVISPACSTPIVSRRSFVATCGALLAMFSRRPAWATEAPKAFNVRNFGATGDGTTLDTLAINRTISAAAEIGGGFVDLPAGRYLCFTIHLRSHIALRFAPGAVVLAATPDFSQPSQQYDTPEPQPDDIRHFQDYGHNHWHNSLFWGEDLEGVSFIGPGELWGRGLQKGDGPEEEHSGAGNKVIALKRCRNVLLRDFAIREAGHFGILATAVDNLTIENLSIDTGRDGIDIDACRNVHIHACTVNSPFDDAIVLKSSYSLGVIRPTEQVTISDCTITASYAVGSVLDDTYRPLLLGAAGGWPARVGRIKIGTETSGDIRNIVVTNCTLDGCHGLAVISEDGGVVEDVVFSNLTMRNMVGPPIFVRLGGRLRGPAPVKPGAIRRINFNQIDCVSSSSDDCSILAGIPGHPVEQITVTDLRVRHEGPGKTRTEDIPEQIAAYPEPNMFGDTPAHGFYLRHAQQIELRHILVEPGSPEPRPLVWMDDVRNSQFDDVRSTDPSSSTISGVNTEAISIAQPFSTPSKP
jgi:polygalacturonase